MNKKQRIVLFNGICGFITSIILFFIIVHIENVSFNYYTLSYILYLEGMSYAILMLYLLSDIIFSEQIFLSKTKMTALLILISPPFVFHIGKLFISNLESTSSLEILFPFGITFSYLLYEAFWKKTFSASETASPTAKNTVQCTKCKNYFDNRIAFCPSCHTISPKVMETYYKYPQKHYLDFTESVDDIHYVRCPHCNHRRRGYSSIHPGRINTPFRCCGHCGNFYTNRSCFEWSVISPLRKLQYCLYGDSWLGVLMFGIILFYIITTHSILLGLIFLAVLFLIHILWLRFITVLDIFESEARLQANPDYPQFLANMGYQILDKKYAHMYKRNK